MLDDLTVIIPYRNGGTATIDRLLGGLPESVPVIIVDDLSDS